MSYLLDLVKSFTESELQKFSRMSLTGKEELVRDQYARGAKGNKHFEESALAATLKLSKSHFDKINSVLLNKTIVHFAGEGIKEGLEFLVNKQLYDLTLHQLKLNEKKLRQQGESKLLREYYGHAFKATILFNYNNYPVEQIIYYSSNYISLLDKKDVAEKYRVAAKTAEMLVRYYHARKGGVKKREAAFQNLLKLKSELEGKKIFEAETSVYLGLGAYYETSDPEKGLHYLELAEAAAQKAGDKIPERNKGFILAIMAQYLIVLSRYPEANEKYKEFFARFGPLLGFRLYHSYHYVFCLLIVKDFKRASEVMSTYIDPILQNENARNFHFDIMRLYAIYHLLQYQTEKAGEYLQRIMQFSKEDFTPVGDVLFRLVHNVYCAQTKDYAWATRVLKKNLKYINGKIDIEGFGAYKSLFLDLAKVIRFKSKGKEGDKFAEAEIQTGEGITRLYCDLIKLPLQ